MVYNEINSDKEYKVLKYLENLLRKTIPKLQEIKHDSFGYKSKRGTVTGLGLASQGINVLPPSIVNLTNLKILTLSDNYRLKLLPQNIGELKNLKILNLRKNQLTELPESIGLLINLEELNLEGNRLEALPDSLCDLIYLRKLLLKNNYRLETFPKNLNKLVSLVEANITSFKLRDQLDKLVKKSKSEKTQPGKLTEETLDFDDSPEERLSIKEIKALEELEKMVGKIPEVEEIEWNTIGYQVEDGKVTGLGLAGKELTKLPTEIVNLESLEILDLNTNKLEELPTNFGSMVNLEELYLMKNRLTELPDSFVELTQLRILDLIHNKLKSLPNNFGKLESLESLELINNQLEELPESMGELKRLKELDLSDNPLKERLDSLKKLEEEGCNISWPLREQ